MQGWRGDEDQTEDQTRDQTRERVARVDAAAVTAVRAVGTGATARILRVQIVAQIVADAVVQTVKLKMVGVYGTLLAVAAEVLGLAEVRE